MLHRDQSCVHIHYALQFTAASVTAHAAAGRQYARTEDGSTQAEPFGSGDKKRRTSGGAGTASKRRSSGAGEGQGKEGRWVSVAGGQKVGWYGQCKFPEIVLGKGTASCIYL